MTTKKILVIISRWPSSLSPYLTYLIAELSKRFPDITYFKFERSREDDFVHLNNQRDFNYIETRSIYRNSIQFNIINILKIILSTIVNLRSTIYLFKNSRLSGFKFHQAIGQIFYYNSLLGKKYDLIYINALQSARHFCLRGLFPNTRIIVSSRGQDFDFDPEGFDKVLVQIDHLHVLGEYLKQKAISRGFQSDRITIIPPAALPAKKYLELNLTKADNEINIISASRLAWTKGYLYSLRAISLVIHQMPSINIKYHIIGEGPEKEFLQVEVVRMGIQGSVIFHGWQPQEKVNELVSRGDLYLLLSIEEGFNNSVLQAQNLGIPCIVSNTGGLPENVEDGVTGIVVLRYDAHTASEAMLKLIQDPVLRKQMGNAACQRAKTEFSLERQVTRYAQMFEKVIEKHADTICL